MRRDVFNALADPTRRDILMSLTSEPRNVNSIAEQFDMSRQAVSLHIKYLLECGVISVKKEGRERYCNLEAQELAKAAEWLAPFRELWENRLDRFDKLVKKLKKK